MAELFGRRAFSSVKCLLRREKSLSCWTSQVVITLDARWPAEDGTQVAKNQVNLVCVSAEPTPVKLHVIEDAALGSVLRELGYQVSEGDVSSSGTDEIIVSAAYTSELEVHLQRGARVLLLADPTGSDNTHDNVALPVGYVALRTDSVWQGDWANSIAWVKKQGPFAGLPGGPLLEMEWAEAYAGRRSGRVAFMGATRSQLGGTDRWLGAQIRFIADDYAAWTGSDSHHDLQTQRDHPRE